MIKKINYFLQSIFVYFFFLVGRLLGLRLSRCLYAIFFSLIGPFFKSRKIVEKNLNIFRKKNSKFNQKKIIKNMWKNYGMTFIEYIFLDRFRKSSSHMLIKDQGILSKVFENKRPVIFISGHFANFELMSMEITKNNIPLATIYRPLNNFFKSIYGVFKKKYICKNQIKKGISGVRSQLIILKKIIVLH